jgi:hypothetical protein
MFVPKKANQERNIPFRYELVIILRKLNPSWFNMRLYTAGGKAFEDEAFVSVAGVVVL